MQELFLTKKQDLDSRKNLLDSPTPHSPSNGFPSTIFSSSFWWDFIFFWTGKGGELIRLHFIDIIVPHVPPILSSKPRNEEHELETIGSADKYKYEYMTCLLRGHMTSLGACCLILILSALCGRNLKTQLYFYG